MANTAIVRFLLSLVEQATPPGAATLVTNVPVVIYNRLLRYFKLACGVKNVQYNTAADFHLLNNQRSLVRVLHAVR